MSVSRSHVDISADRLPKLRRLCAENQRVSQRSFMDRLIDKEYKRVFKNKQEQQDK